MKRDQEMPSTVRLKESEKNMIRKKNIEINKILIMNSQTPISESELVHVALELSLKHLKADKDGSVFLDI